MILETATQYKRQSLRSLSSLDKIIETRGMTYEIFKYYRGTFNTCILCTDPFTQIEEYQDITNIMDITPKTKLIPGMELVIENNNVIKGAILNRVLYGTFYKWEMVSGKYLILSQREIDTLSKKEKRELRMYL